MQGIVGSGAMVTVMAWCVRMRGPLYVSVFSPLMLLIVAIAGSLFLDEKLHLGRSALYNLFPFKSFPFLFSLFFFIL